jgi:negative regulator of flagellin synthesis FlgM
MRAEPPNIGLPLSKEQKNSRFAMKVDNTGKPLAPVLQRTPSVKPSETQKSDPVQLQSFSGRLQQLGASLASQPVVDEGRVSEIRKAISEGKYTVRADAIADKLVASVKELFAGKA